MRRLLSLLLVLVAFLPASAGAAGDEAVAAAEGWLDLVDRQRYSLSWDAAGAALKDGVSQEEWAQTVGAARLHRGLVLARRLAGSALTDAVAGLPPGDYSLIAFDTAFQATGDSVESLILVREGDGRWKVVAYFVRPSP